MIRSLLSYSSLLVGLMASPLLVGCGTPASDSHEAAFGTLSLPLTSVANGHTYRLRNATILVYGNTYSYLESSDDPAETVLSASLETGNYDAYLYGGWSLERATAEGAFEPVQASLESNSATSFSILNGTTTTVAFRFQTDGVTVVVGSGGLQVVLEVNETAPVCVPFSADCGPGAWCPSSALTGAGRACIVEGVVNVGQPCTGPLDCVANATCMDLGAGPLCTALCPSADAGAACSSGGTCQLAGDDYGICTP
ncbi:MAG: hypothetical protein RJA70_1311 [Pseudomonadota bacterium]|jgi:hypothetical protein